MAKSDDNKVVMSKLTREEFSRLNHYCDIREETVSGAIKRIVLDEVDKPTTENIVLKKGVMFDTNSFDKILDGLLPVSLIKNSLVKGYRYFVTHIQTDELSNTPDQKKDKRANLVLFLSTVSPSLIPTESFILGYSRLNFSKLGTAGFYEQLLNESKTNIKDSIIGDTAIKNQFLLITEDKRFAKKVKSLGGDAINLDSFRKLLETEVKN